MKISNWDEVLTFGKYTVKEALSLSPYYLKWLVTNTDRVSVDFGTKILNAVEDFEMRNESYMYERWLDIHLEDLN